MTTIYVTDKDTLPKRSDADLYETEHTLIQAAMEVFAPAKAFHVLDIGAGDGRWGAYAKQYTDCRSLVGVERRDVPPPSKDFYLWYNQTDFLEFNTSPLLSFDFIVSNPPYYIAEPIIKHAWTMLADRGTMIMLLRLSFQAGVKRYKSFWNKYPPTTVGVLARRPSFYGGGTNATDYGLFHWIKGQGTPGQWPTILINYEREPK